MFRLTGSLLQAKIEAIKQQKEATAESMLRTQFKMELLVYSQDRTYSSSLSESRSEEDEEEYDRKGKLRLTDRSHMYTKDSHATLQELMLHLKSYYRVRFHLVGKIYQQNHCERFTKSAFVKLFVTFFYFLLQIAGQRLADQIPLVIRYHMLQECAIQLQREMLQMLQDKENLEILLKEDSDIGGQRAALQSRLTRLMKARGYLLAF